MEKKYQLAEARGRVYDSILETIGGTPMVRLPGLARKYGFKADVLAKLEFFNPLASVKDRIALAMIEDAEQRGEINPDKTTLIEPTSGNTGIGLAFVAAAKGYKLILTMPESMSIERRKMLQFLGARLVLTPAEKGMGGAIAMAEELKESTEGSVILGQFTNPANPEVHEESTAEEVWKDTNGDIDIFISGVGTGGTVTGTGKALKEKNASIQVFAVEPVESPVLSGGEAGPHKIQGIGAGFIPEVMNVDGIDGALKVSSDEAFAMAREVAQLDGLACGISSGAALHVAVQEAVKDKNEGKTLVVIIPSFAERYVSTPLFDFSNE